MDTLGRVLLVSLNKFDSEGNFQSKGSGWVKSETEIEQRLAEIWEVLVQKQGPVPPFSKLTCTCEIIEPRSSEKAQAMTKKKLSVNSKTKS